MSIRLDAVALACALLAAAAAAGLAPAPAPTTPHALPTAASKIERITLPDGTTAVRDARGHAIPLRPYQRIASLSIMADALLCELAEPQRVISASFWSTGPWTHRLGSLPRLKGLDELESIIALKPDLVLISSFGGELDRIERLRTAGLTVCDLGPQGGFTCLATSAHLIAALLGDDTRGERFVHALRSRLDAVAADMPATAPRRTALYVQCIGDTLFGGTVGTSFHDVITAAGLRDRAADAGYSGWPQYTIEDLLRLNPDLIVTMDGSSERIRRLPRAERLHACQNSHGIIELPTALLQCPGPVMLDAAEALHVSAAGQ